MEKRRAGEVPTLDTRAEAEGKVNKQIRYKQIIECLKENGDMTAKECAVLMMHKGYIPTSERNFTAPRMTEMTEKGIIEPIGKKKCTYTGRTVAIYALREVG